MINDQILQAIGAVVISVIASIAGGVVQVLLMPQQKNELSYYVIYKGNSGTNNPRIKKLRLPKVAYDSPYIVVLKLRNSGTNRVDTRNFAKKQIKFKFESNINGVELVDSYPFDSQERNSHRVYPDITDKKAILVHPSLLNSQAYVRFVVTFRQPSGKVKASPLNIPDFSEIVRRGRLHEALSEWQPKLHEWLEYIFFALSVLVFFLILCNWLFNHSVSPIHTDILLFITVAFLMDWVISYFRLGRK